MMIKEHINVILLSVLLLVGSCSYPTDNRHNTKGPNTIDLNGEWDFTYTPGRQKKPPANELFKAKMVVPGCWDDSFNQKKSLELWPNAQFNPDYKEFQKPEKITDETPDASLPYLFGKGWYRRSLDVPTEWRGRQVVLSVGRVVMEAFVYVNGKQIYHHLGHSTPWEAVISPHLEYGKKNELIICVDNRRNDRVGTVIRGWKGRSAGIFGPTSLKINGKARVADLFVCPEGDQLAWRVELEGSIPENAQLRWRVFDPNSGKEYGKGKQQAEGNRVDWSTSEMGIPLWSDTDPQLVDLEVELLDKTGRIDLVRQPFGLRILASDGLGLKLNGKPVFLRGISEHSYYPETTTPPIDLEWYHHHILRLKQLGFNWIRGHTWALTEPYLQAADELGMLVQVEPPLGYEMNEWLDIIRSCRKHPSVVIYCPGNEEMLDDPKIKFLRSCADELCRLSPDALFMPQQAMRGVEYMLEDVPKQELTMSPFPHNSKRLKILRDFSDVFGQYALGWFSYTSLQGSPEEVDKRLAIYKRPILEHELGIIGSFLNLSLEERYQNTRMGPEHYSRIRESLEEAGLIQRAERYYKNSVSWQMLIAKHVFEKARRSPYIAGYDMLGSNDSHWIYFGYACGLLNEFDELKAGVTVADIKRFNSPSILMIGQHKKRNIIAGRSIKRDVFVSWFGDTTLAASKLRWSLVTPDGKVLDRGEMETQPVLQGQSEKIGTIDISLPALEKAGKASLQVTLAAPGVELENQWDYWIFPRIMPKANDNILVVNKLDSIALQRLSQGGRVVLLGHKPFVTKQMNFQMGLAGRPFSNQATLIEKHPLTDRFPHEGFCDWQFATMLDRAVPVQFNNLDISFDPIIEVANSYKYIRKQALVFEWSVGKGRLLVCGLNLSKADPAVDYFRQILFDYAAGDQFQPQTQITLETLAKMMQKVPSLQKPENTNKALNPNGQLPGKTND